MWFKDLNEFKERSGYEIDRIWYPRVTSIVGIKSKPALYGFYASLPDIKTGDDIKNKSAEEGTAIHAAVEAILKKEPLTVQPEIMPAVAAFKNFHSQHDIVAHKIEERIISKKHHYSGTMDVLAEVDGVLGVLDIKTSKAIYRDYSLQTSAYVEAVREDPYIPPLTRWILRIDQSQTCRLCGGSMRTKGGHVKIKNERKGCGHDWTEVMGEVEFKEITTFDHDIKAFLACKTLWEWEHSYWLRQI